MPKQYTIYDEDDELPRVLKDGEGLRIRMNAMDSAVIDERTVARDAYIARTADAWKKPMRPQFSDEAPALATSAYNAISYCPNCGVSAQPEDKSCWSCDYDLKSARQRMGAAYDAAALAKARSEVRGRSDPERFQQAWTAQTAFEVSPQGPDESGDPAAKIAAARLEHERHLANAWIGGRQ